MSPDFGSLAFISGDDPAEKYPMGRYLPPTPRPMVQEWVKSRGLAGKFLIDPLGSTPGVAIEAAQAGCRVLAAVNNPILNLMFEVLASAPRREDFQAVLSELGDTRRGDERLEIHLRNLYQTECAVCHQLVQTEAFIWRQNEETPYARVYHCPACGDDGERPITPADLDRLALCGSDQLHRSRALERVCGRDDPQRPDVENALRFYPRRPLYVLSTLINKVEGMAMPAPRKRLLYALILSLCDAGNTLWPWPGGRTRPRQLTIPPVFRENNLWLELDEAIDEWTVNKMAIPLTIWPNLPPAGGGICLYSGRIKALVAAQNSAVAQNNAVAQNSAVIQNNATVQNNNTGQPGSTLSLSPDGILTSFPRPSQAFWTLSAIWTGWIWGREAVQPLKAILERRRFDWHWHAGALNTALSAIRPWMKPDVPFWGLIGDIAPGFLAAVITSAAAAGFEINGLALREEDEIAQALWLPVEKPGTETPVLPGDLDQICGQAMKAYLEERGEPSGYLQLYAAALYMLARQNGLSSVPDQPASDLFTSLQGCMSRCFTNPALLHRFDGGAQELERGRWWLASAENTQTPLKDRVEMELVRILQKTNGITLSAVETALLQRFTGLMIPSGEFIKLCLESYAETSSTQTGLYQFRAQDQPAARKQEINQNRSTLIRIGKQLDYKVIEEPSLEWQEKDGTPAYTFTLIASSIIARHVILPSGSSPTGERVLVFPGSRARLLSYKLRQDPRLAEKLTQGWHLLKFRHLRTIAETDGLTRDLWKSLVDADPPFWEDATQISMF